jgi:hypothetical protein
MKTTSQPMSGLVARPPHWVAQVVLATAALALTIALAVSFASGGHLSIGGTGTSVDRAAEDALIQFRKDERNEKYAPSVEDIRRSLIQFRKDEREERWLR